MHWELWDTETSNLVGEYDSEDEALVVIRDALRQLGPAAIAPIALGAEHDDEGGLDDDLPAVVQGQDLIALAQRGPTGQAAGAP